MGFCCSAKSGNQSQSVVNATQPPSVTSWQPNILISVLLFSSHSVKVSASATGNQNPLLLSHCNVSLQRGLGSTGLSELSTILQDSEENLIYSFNSLLLYKNIYIYTLWASPHCFGSVNTKPRNRWSYGEGRGDGKMTRDTGEEENKLRKSEGTCPHIPDHPQLTLSHNVLFGSGTR